VHLYRLSHVSVPPLYLPLERSPLTHTPYAARARRRRAPRRSRAVTPPAYSSPDSSSRRRDITAPAKDHTNVAEQSASMT